MNNGVFKGLHKIYTSTLACFLICEPNHHLLIVFNYKQLVVSSSKSKTNNSFLFNWNLVLAYTLFAVLVIDTWIQLHFNNYIGNKSSTLAIFRSSFWRRCRGLPNYKPNFKSIEILLLCDQNFIFIW